MRGVARSLPLGSLPYARGVHILLAALSCAAILCAGMPVGTGSGGGGHSRANVSGNVMSHAPTRAQALRLVVGGSISADSPILESFRGFPPGGVKFITAAGTSPEADAVTIEKLLREAGVQDPEWIPVYGSNCAERTRDAAYVDMVERADAIFMSGGQSGRLQSCLYGRYTQSGLDPSEGETTPFLEALQRTLVVGGSSAGAMNQPLSDILITASSAESYAAVAAGTIFSRQAGNKLLQSEELVDVHFSERGRQGRLLVFAAATRQRLAFGVDENTAYLWRPGPNTVYEVVGAGGVVIFVNAEGSVSSQRSVVHYLTAGDAFDPATESVIYAPQKTPCRGGENPPTASNAVFSSINWLTVSLAASQASTGTIVENYHGSPAVQVNMENTQDTHAWCGNDGSVSFEGLSVVQHASATLNNSAVTPDLPLDHIWLTDM
eukprot:m.162428 g.162428  ORF g.162428 m.162428 type:complete len:436 (-) comp23877_c0_seq1:50-1357(-)